MRSYAALEKNTRANPDLSSRMTGHLVAFEGLEGLSIVETSICVTFEESRLGVQRT